MAAAERWALFASFKRGAGWKFLELRAEDFLQDQCIFGLGGRLQCFYGLLRRGEGSLVNLRLSWRCLQILPPHIQWHNRRQKPAGTGQQGDVQKAGKTWELVLIFHKCKLNSVDLLM